MLCINPVSALIRGQVIGFPSRDCLLCKGFSENTYTVIEMALQATVNCGFCLKRSVQSLSNLLALFRGGHLK